MQTDLKFKGSMSGHILVATLVVAGVLGIALAAYLNVLHTQNNLTVRSQVWNACMPVVEAGIEEALAHMNSTGTTNWASNGWGKDSGNNFLKTNSIGSGFFTCTISTNGSAFPVITCTGKLPAPVTIGTGRNPLVAVAGGASPPATIYISRTVRVKTTKPPALIKGLMAKVKIDFNGTTTGTDSYNSAFGAYLAPLAGGLFNQGANGDIAVNGDIVNIGNADVHGHVAVGPKAKVNVGPTGFIGDLSILKGIQKGWIRYDMNVDLADVQRPWPAGTAGAPKSGSSGSGPGYKYLMDAQNYELDSLTINSGDVVLVTNGIATLWVKGNADIQGAITVSQPGGLRLYVGGSVSLSGTWDKSALPADLMIYGLPTCTTVNVTTGSKLEAVIYAPQATLTLKGNANLFGSATAGSIILTGNSMFHYDDALSNVAPSIYTVTSWQEL